MLERTVELVVMKAAIILNAKHILACLSNFERAHLSSCPVHLLCKIVFFVYGETCPEDRKTARDI